MMLLIGLVLLLFIHGYTYGKPTPRSQMSISSVIPLEGFSSLNSQGSELDLPSSSPKQFIPAIVIVQNLPPNPAMNTKTPADQRTLASKPQSNIQVVNPSSGAASLMQSTALGNLLRDTNKVISSAMNQQKRVQTAQNLVAPGTYVKVPGASKIAPVVPQMTLTKAGNSQQVLQPATETSLQTIPTKAESSFAHPSDPQKALTNDVHLKSEAYESFHKGARPIKEATDSDGFSSTTAKDNNALPESNLEAKLAGASEGVEVFRPLHAVLDAKSSLRADSHHESDVTPGTEMLPGADEISSAEMLPGIGVPQENKAWMSTTQRAKHLYGDFAGVQDEYSMTGFTKNRILDNHRVNSNGRNSSMSQKDDEAEDQNSLPLSNPTPTLKPGLRAHIAPIAQIANGHNTAPHIYGNGNTAVHSIANGNYATLHNFVIGNNAAPHSTSWRKNIQPTVDDTDEKINSPLLHDKSSNASIEHSLSGMNPNNKKGEGRSNNHSLQSDGSEDLSNSTFHSKGSGGEDDESKFLISDSDKETASNKLSNLDRAQVGMTPGTKNAFSASTKLPAESPETPSAVKSTDPSASSSGNLPEESQTDAEDSPDKSEEPSEESPTASAEDFFADSTGNASEESQVSSAENSTTANDNKAENGDTLQPNSTSTNVSVMEPSSNSSSTENESKQKISSNDDGDKSDSSFSDTVGASSDKVDGSNENSTSDSDNKGNEKPLLSSNNENNETVASDSNNTNGTKEISVSDNTSSVNGSSSLGSNDATNNNLSSNSNDEAEPSSPSNDGSKENPALGANGDTTEGSASSDNGQSSTTSTQASSSSVMDIDMTMVNNSDTDTNSTEGQNATLTATESNSDNQISSEDGNTETIETSTKPANTSADNPAEEFKSSDVNQTNGTKLNDDGMQSPMIQNRHMKELDHQAKDEGSGAEPAYKAKETQVDNASKKDQQSFIEELNPAQEHLDNSKHILTVVEN